jgi:diguanylate cyclase (GGDEF)-like protein
MKPRIPRIVARGLSTQPLNTPPGEDSPGLLSLVSVLAGASSPQEAAGALLAHLRQHLGSHFYAEVGLATPRPELMASVDGAGPITGETEAPYVVHWLDGDRELGYLKATGLSTNERAMLDAWMPWLQPSFKRLAGDFAQLENRLVVERQARLWRIKAELLALSQGPQTSVGYLALAVTEVQRLMGAQQAVFWTYQTEDDSLEARYYAVPECADSAPLVSLQLFQEAVLGRTVRTVAVATAEAEPCVYLLGPVFNENGLTGVLQVVLPTAVLGGAFEEELAAAAEVIARGLNTIGCFEKLSYQASHDPLTGLANRRTFQMLLDREFKLGRRHQAPLSMVVVDVDHFKRYNDTYGHAAGDALLREIANALAAAARSTDFVARFGGEEFVVILPHTDVEGAHIAASKLHEAVRVLHQQALVLGGSVTASVGVATVSAAFDSPERLFEAADQAMYQAKQTGRDRVCQA